MKVQLVDPSAFTPPYDRALAAALARAGAEVELLTSRFLYGAVPPAEGYRVEERFYRRSAARGLDAPARLAFKAAEHVPDMLRFRRDAAADVVHYQWLTVPSLDVHLLPQRRPRVMTAHYILPPRPSRRQAAPPAASSTGWTPSSPTPSTAPPGCATRSASTGQGPRHPPRRLRLPHPPARREAAAARAGGSRGPGDPLLRPAPPLQGDREPARAFRQVEGAELWIVGNPRMDVAPLRAPPLTGAAVRFVTRFVDDAEIPAIFRRADLLVLPYLDAEHSGVLYTGLAFGKPMVLSAVGGFPEVAATGAGGLVPPGDAEALAAALAELVDDEAARAELAAAARARRRRPLLLGRGRPPNPRPLRELLGRHSGDNRRSPRSPSGSAPA